MNTLLHSAIRAHAEARPDTIAIRFRKESLTYAELEQQSNRLSHLLGAAGCGKGDRVALLMPKSPAAIVAMLAVLKADAAYVPLDPAGPAPRLSRMLESADCSFVLAAGPVEGMLSDALAGAKLANKPLLGWLQEQPPSHLPWPAAFAWSDIAAWPTMPREQTATQDDLAHILFTSGSTGVPKGVMITHGNVLNFVRWAIPYFGIGPADRTSQHSPLHFDLSTFDIYGSLSAGAELHLVPPELNLLPQKMVQFMREARLTQWFSVPSALNLMLKYDVLAQDDLPELKRLLWCGEAMPVPTLMHCMRRLPHASFTNLYGPTEATIASSYYTVPHCPAHERAEVPIGLACPGEELLVLDNALQPCAAGETGDLYIGGAGLSPGYWRDEDKTRNAFFVRPGGKAQERIYKTGDLARRGEDGLVYFLGRADTQIKSRGYRIELGEIEAAASATGALAECAVVAIPTEGFEAHAICCAYTARPGSGLTTVELREQLKALLPSYMLPSRWQALSALPKNANGKTDKPALRELFQRAQGAALAPPPINQHSAVHA